MCLTSRGSLDGEAYDLSEPSQTQLNDIARLLNQRPRKALDFMMPEEAMTEEL